MCTFIGNKERAELQLVIDDDNMPCRGSTAACCIFPKENNITREQDLLKFPSDCLALYCEELQEKTTFRVFSFFP